MKPITLLLLCLISAGSYSQDYTRYTGENGKFGLKDQSGKIIIQARYDYINNTMSDGHTWGMIGDKLGFITKEGKPLTPFKYSDVTDFQNGFARVNIGATLDKEQEQFVGGKWAFIDASGKEITSVRYDDLSNFTKQGFAIVCVGKKWTIINTAGKEIAPLKYDYIEVSTTEPRIAVVNIGGKYDEVFGDASFNKYIGGKQGFINCVTGREILPAQYAVVADFAEGLAAVNKGGVFDGEDYSGGKWGYVDTTDKLVIPFQYDYAGYFTEGRSKVTVNEKTYYVDKTGKEVK